MELIERFLKDYNIEYVTDHQHCTKDSIQIHCPFCEGKRNFHLGIFRKYGNGNCWRCGSHTKIEIIQALLRCSTQEAWQVAKKYSVNQDKERPILRIFKNKYNKFNFDKTLKFPITTEKMGNRHKQYLINRNFNPEELVKQWNLFGTGKFGTYRNRIIIPIYYQKKLVSYQGRDITELSSIRYKACSLKDEIIHHKHILYGIDKVNSNERIIVVEGAVDVWRLGYGAVATFGIEWTKQQLYLLSQFQQVYIWYDNQPQAQKQANKLANELALITSVDIINLDTVKDPAELRQEIADEYVRKIMN